MLELVASEKNAEYIPHLIKVGVPELEELEALLQKNNTLIRALMQNTIEIRNLVLSVNCEIKLP